MNLGRRQTDVIFIEGMEIPMIIGIMPHERNIPQTIIISLWLGTSTKAAGVSDDLADSIDYAEVERCLRDDLRRKQFNLLERLAEYIATFVLSHFNPDWARVSVEKSGILPGARSVGVIIERLRC